MLLMFFYRYARRDFVGKILGTGQGGGKCYGKATGEVDPSLFSLYLVWMILNIHWVF